MYRKNVVRQRFIIAWVDSIKRMLKHNLRVGVSPVNSISKALFTQ